MLNDLFGYFRRNMKNMNDFEKKKMLKEIKQIESMITRDLSGKPKEASQYVG